MNDVFQALSDPTRRQILSLLRDGDLSAGQICAHFDLARSTMSGHFRVLKHAHLIVPERNGTTIVYSLNVSVLESVVSSVMRMLDVGEGKPND
ncbi:MAG: autorepressor SdpR family transcription factor [Planctomycetaceae bacterium]|nr:autorepressor SdpR family transcription factor [Planctomycetaceae bacterium]